MILGSWFSSIYAIVLFFGVCYYVVALLFSCFKLWFDTVYTLVWCGVFWYARVHTGMEAKAVVQQDKLLSLSRLWERRYEG